MDLQPYSRPILPEKTEVFKMKSSKERLIDFIENMSEDHATAFADHLIPMLELIARLDINQLVYAETLLSNTFGVSTIKH